VAGVARSSVNADDDAAQVDLAELQALRSCWRDRQRVGVLQSGFAAGRAFLRAWQLWRDDERRCGRLHFIVVDPALPEGDALCGAHAGSPLEHLAVELVGQWPPLTDNLHRLAFDEGRVQLLLAPGPLLQRLGELLGRVDVFWIEAADLRADPREGQRRLARGLARLAARAASLHLARPTSALRQSLHSAGFAIDAARAGGPIRAHYTPHFEPRSRSHAAHRQTFEAATKRRHALIIGAGLAGCATAWALAEHGWSCTLFDRQDTAAAEASGNPAGLFHGTVNPQDGAHARFNLAAALEAQRAVHVAIDRYGVAGALGGVLRLEQSAPDLAAMHEQIARQQLPPGYVQALDAGAASERCGLPLAYPAWFYPGGGWVQPAGLANAFLKRAGHLAQLRASTPVQSLKPHGGGWQLLDRHGSLIDECETVVLANAADALRLLGASHWPVQTVRGQLSVYDNAGAAEQRRLRLPRIPVAGEGYLLPQIDGQAVFGATAQPGDAEAAARLSDHAHNLRRLQRLSPQPFLPDVESLRARIGWRCACDDGLPLIGAAPDEAAASGRRFERLTELPRLPGLYVFRALGSRGIAWAALGAQVLAALIGGAPPPLEARLLQAIDPARFALRRSRRPRST
jgi:tRNA 5-methylaminomethyl-2-thiouridine biosynthesis bifunctional protein